MADMNVTLASTEVYIEMEAMIVHSFESLTEVKGDIAIDDVLLAEIDCSNLHGE